MRVDLFGNHYIADSGIGAQIPLFHEPVKAAPLPAPFADCSKNARDPKHTPQLFPAPVRPEGVFRRLLRENQEQRARTAALFTGV